MFMGASLGGWGKDKGNPSLVLSLLVFLGKDKIPLMGFADKFIVAGVVAATGFFRGAPGHL